MYPILPPARPPAPGWPLVLGAGACWLLGLAAAAVAGADSVEMMNVFAGAVMWLICLAAMRACLAILVVRQIRGGARWALVAALGGGAVAVVSQVLAIAA